MRHFPLLRALPAFLAALALSAGAAASSTAPAAATPDNAEAQALFAADQAVRTGIKPAQIADRAFVTRMVEADRQRRAAMRRLLDAGALHSAADYYAAAFVFQHGGTSDDYLLAHSLALAALAQGRKDAAWIAAATLDRYLQKIGQKQIYGTQFISRTATGATMEPYDPALLPDTLRAALGVPDQAAQQARLQAMQPPPAPAK